MGDPTRVILRVPYPAECDLPVCVQKPWEWVAAFLLQLTRCGEIQAVGELEYKRIRRRVEFEPIVFSISNPATVDSVARRAVKSGAVFLAAKVPIAKVQALLVELGYLEVPKGQMHLAAHILGGREGFEEAIMAMLPGQRDGSAVCCFSHDGEYAYLF